MADEQQAQAANHANDGGQQSGAQAQQQSQEAKFTQADLDRIINERLGRVKSQYADYDELKKKVESQEQAQKSETEKLAERAAKAEQKAKEVAEQTTARLLNAEARATAAELGFSKPDKAIKLADLADAVKDGEVDGTKVRTALEALAKEMPELLKATTKSAPAVGATNAAKSDAGAKETDAQRRERLRGGSSINDWLGSGTLFFPERHPK